MATNYHGGGSQSPTSLTKPIERVFEDAQHTGEIQLSCRKLRDYPKLAAKYDLVDTISADVSKNRLNEVPKEVCNYMSMEKLNCYHNVIKSVPEAITQLQALTYLNLSRNQLSIIPSFINKIQTLEVLIASHNRLVSLPEEIGILDKLMELDVSCNEISHLPMQIGDLKSLKSLNVRSNLLQELPVEISKLNLRKLDISGNRISRIPTLFRKIETLEDIVLNNNPLILPPAHVCTKGKQHIMKYLQIEAIREDKKRGILNENEMKRFRKSLPPQQSVSSEEFRNLMESPDKWKRHTVLSSDSGYSTTDSIEKCGWSPQETNSEPQHLIDSNNLAVKAAAAASKDQRFMTAGSREPRREPPEPPKRTNSRLSPEKPSIAGAATPPYSLSMSKTSFTTPPTPPTLYPPSPQTPLTPPTPQGPGPGSGMNMGSGILGTSLEDEFTRELQRQKQDYENKKKLAEQLRIQQEEEEEREQRRRAAQRIQDEQRAMLDRQREEARLQEEARALLQAEEAKRQEEMRLAEEAQRAEEARAAEDARRQEEARCQEEARRQEEVKQHRVDNFYYNTHNSNYNNNNNAWPPPPPSLTNQHEVNSPLSPNHFSSHSPNLNLNKCGNPISPNTNLQYGQQYPSPNQYGDHQQQDGHHSQNQQHQYGDHGQQQHQYGDHGQQQNHYGHQSRDQYGSSHIQHNQPSIPSNQPNNPYRTNPASSSGQYQPNTISPQSGPSRANSEYSDSTLYNQYDNTRQHGTTPHDIYNSMPLDPYAGYRKPSLSASNSFKEERRPAGGTQQYRRTVSDSNQRLPVQTQQKGPPPPSSLTNGPIEEQPNMNGSTPTNQSSNPSPNTSFNSQHSTPPHSASVSTNGPTSHRPTTPQESTSRRPKTSERGPSTISSTSKVAKPSDKHGRVSTSSTTSTRSGVPTARKTNLNQDEEIRKSQTNLKTGSRTSGEQRVRTIQKEAVNNYMNRRSSGSTSSEDDRKRATPTRTTAGAPRSTGLTNTSTATAASKRSGTGMSSTTSTRVSATSRTPASSRAAPSTTTATSQARRNRQNSTSSTASVSSTTSKTSVDKSKRAGTVMTNAHVKMLEDYNKEGSPNFTLGRQHDRQRDGHDQLETLRKTISTRLKRTLPDNLSEALSDGVLLCHLANQIRPRSVASVHVPSPAVPKLTPAKCRRNVENFLEACRKIGVPKDQICGSSDILEEKGITRVAVTVAALVAIATHPRHAPASNV